MVELIFYRARGTPADRDVTLCSAYTEQHYEIPLPAGAPLADPLGPAPVNRR